MSRDPDSSYYDAGGIETFDVIKAKLTPEQFKGYLLGNAIKYSCRLMHKTPGSNLRDAMKLKNYSKWLVEEYEKEETPTQAPSAELPWDNFPSWAKYFAQDASGFCFVFESEPQEENIKWMPVFGKRYASMATPEKLSKNPKHTWRSSLRKRP